jgi:hypothetical protein
MNKYSVILSGNAIEAYLFTISQETHQKAKELDLSDINTLIELNLEDKTEASIIVCGLLDNDDSVFISVYDESNELIYENEISKIKSEIFEFVPKDELYLITEDRINGDILRFEFHDEEFNIENLELAMTFVGYHYIITTVKWREDFLEVHRDYLDYQLVSSETYLI